MKKTEFRFNKKQSFIRIGDFLEGMKSLPENSVDFIVTDPPYFIDGLGSDWNADTIDASKKKASIIGSLPVGMKYDRQQSYDFEKFMKSFGEEAMRILVPGGFLVSFSQGRLYHRLATAMEDSGFEIRDILGWVYEGQAKAFTQDHFIRKRKDLTDTEKSSIIEKLQGRKTPQLKPQIEPMVLAQKPKEGTFVDNWLKYGTGLIDTTVSLDGKFPGNIMIVPKPNKKEKGEDNIHITVKPVELIKHLIKIFTTEGQVVLDPFMGSGTTAVACVATKRKCVGFEIEKRYFEVAKNRVNSINKQTGKKNTI